MHTFSRLFCLGLIAASMLLGGACAEGAALDDDGDDSPPRRTPVDGGLEDAKAPRSDASSSSSSGGSSGAASSSSGSDAGPDAGPSGSAACAAALAAINLNFEDFDPGVTGNVWYADAIDGFAGNDSWPFNPWRVASTTFGTACKAGKCLGTELAANYIQCQRAQAGSPKIDLSACAGQSVELVFDQAYDFKDFGGGFKDGGLVEMSGNAATVGSATWTQVGAGAMPGEIDIRTTFSGSSCLAQDGFSLDGKPGYVGARTTTYEEALDLPQSVLTANARVRFLFSSGVAYAGTNAETSRASTRMGWRIDNVHFEQKP